ncbi:hypothetical protein [Emticicia aquatilis]|nr:hypothetical protein [Emticicia aquatilis]
MNTIEFSESHGKRAFKASFTDTVGNSMSETFGAFLANKVTQQIAKRNSTQKTTDNHFDVQDFEIVDNDQKALPNTSHWSEIFVHEGDKTTLIQPALKAKSKNDFAKRLVCLFLQYKKDNGIEIVPRNEISVLMQDCGIDDGNSRTMISQEKSLFRSDSSGVRILLPGSEFVKEIRSSISNTEIQNGWKLGTTRKNKKSKNKGEKEAEQ